MYKLICLFALVAFAAATYSAEQKDEIIDDIVHEMVPVLSIDRSCLKENGLDSVQCLLSNLVSCFRSSNKNIGKMAACLASKCGVTCIKCLVKCIKL